MAASLLTVGGLKVVDDFVDDFVNDFVVAPSSRRRRAQRGSQQARVGRRMYQYMQRGV